MIFLRIKGVHLFLDVVLTSCDSNGKGDPNQQGFGVSLLKALLDNMPYLPAAATGGTYLKSQP